jgi:hypothetical protein
LHIAEGDGAETLSGVCRGYFEGLDGAAVGKETGEEIVV